MKPKYIIGIVATVILISAAVWSVENRKIEYMDLHTAASTGQRAQIAGSWVKEKGCSYDPVQNKFTFTLRDDKGNTMPVVFNDAKPNNFELAVSVVLTGKVEGNIFVASNILTKCPSKYESQGEELKKQI